MPIYIYKCCGVEDEVIQQIGADAPGCLKCGMTMIKKPTHQAYVEMKGTPSFRRKYLGTAPYTSRDSKYEDKGGPGSKLPTAKVEGEKWLESLA